MTPRAFLEDLESAKPGEAVLYATAVALKPGPLTRAALMAYARGEVELVQRRLSGPFHDGRQGKFAYYAIKRRQVRKPFIDPKVIL
jgi:hypothetical protein